MTSVQPSVLTVLPPDVVPNNIRPKHGVSVYLTETLPKEHTDVCARIQKLEEDLASARTLRSYIEAVAAAALVSLPMNER